MTKGGCSGLMKSRQLLERFTVVEESREEYSGDFGDWIT